MKGFARIDTCSGRNPMLELAAMLRFVRGLGGEGLYTSFHCLELSPEPWVNMSRTRTKPVPHHALAASGFAA